MQPDISDEMKKAGFVYIKPIIDEETISTTLKEKFKKSRKIFQDTKLITINVSEAPKIEIPIDPDILKKYKFSDEHNLKERR